MRSLQNDGETGAGKKQHIYGSPFGSRRDMATMQKGRGRHIKHTHTPNMPLQNIEIREGRGRVSVKVKIMSKKSSEIFTSWMSHY